MAYTEQLFVKGQTLKAEQLNKMDAAIASLDKSVDALNKGSGNSGVSGVFAPNLLVGVNISVNNVLDSNGGTFVNDAGLYSTTDYVPVKQGVTYYCGEYRYIALYDSNHRFISISGSDELNPESFVPTADGFVRFTISNRTLERGWEYLSVNPKGYTLSTKVNAEIEEAFTAPYDNMISRVRTVPGYIFADNVPGKNDNYCYTTYIPVKAGVEYVVYPRVRSLNIHDSSKKILKNVVSTNDSMPIRFTPEANGYVRITLYAVDYDADLCGMCTKDEYMNGVRNGGSSLAGISIFTFGDSIMAARSGVINTVDLLRNNHGIGGINYGVGGYTLARFDGSERGSILNKIDNALKTVSPDIILLEGGCNDYSLEVPLGAMTDYLDFSGNYDETTYLGALETALYKLKNNYPDALIIWIYVHKHSRTANATANFQVMHDESLEVCEKWGIPVVDIYSEGNMNTRLQYHKQAYTDSADGVHPNSLGHKKFYYPMIYSKIKQVLGI